MGSSINGTRGDPGCTVIIADDLTGACDAAVYFAEAGLATLVSLHFDDSPAADCKVCAINTDTRSSSREEAAWRVRHVCAGAKELKAQRIIKKIDSMMRGNIAAEIAAACAVLRPRMTLLTPAFPALGRTVRNGRVHIDGCEQAIGIADRLEGLRCSSIPAASLGELAAHVARAAGQKIDVLIPDILNEGDLVRVTEAAAGVEGLFWAGSGGLTKAIASRMDTAGKHTSNLRRTQKPVLLCAGSDHGATLAQLKYLEIWEQAEFIEASPDGYRKANTTLEEERNVVLLFQRSDLNASARKAFAESMRVNLCGGLILTGGDTAIHILEALGARSIRSRAEISPGMPQGEILGGMADGLLLVTKSGAFGGPDALSRCIKGLRGSPANAAMGSEEAIG